MFVFRGSDGAYVCGIDVPDEHGEPLDMTVSGELLVACGYKEPQCFVHRGAVDGAWLRARAIGPLEVGDSRAGVAVGACGEVVVACNGREHVFE